MKGEEPLGRRANDAGCNESHIDLPVWQSAQFMACRSPMSTGCWNSCFGGSNIGVPACASLRTSWQMWQSFDDRFPGLVHVLIVVAAEAAR